MKKKDSVSVLKAALDAKYQELTIVRETVERQREELRDLKAELGTALNKANQLGYDATKREQEANGKFTMSPAACLCGACLEEAFLKIGTAEFYLLSVAPKLKVLAKKLLRTYGAAHPDNPFAAYVNLEVTEELGPYGWCLAGNGKSCSSTGVI